MSSLNLSVGSCARHHPLPSRLIRSWHAGSKRKGSHGEIRNRNARNNSTYAASRGVVAPPAPNVAPSLPPTQLQRPSHPRSPQDDFKLNTGLAVTWLGTSSGAPTLHRNVSGTLVRFPQATYMIDCGEGNHRQFLTAQLNPADIESIFITHLHGDHCFGLGQTLLTLDAAKASLADPALRHTHVYGPPGIFELLRASLIIPGTVGSMRVAVTLSELVVDPRDAHAPQPVEGTNGLFMIQRLAPRSVASVPGLQASIKAVAPRLKMLPTVFRPPLPMPSRSQERSDFDYSGRGYVARDGIFWDIPCRHARVLAAQLQHRVPCWGYVVHEATPAMGARRKVVILGDTISSTAIAPFAYGADMVAHEATFMRGMEDKCRMAQHSTGWMAGSFAKCVRAQHLVLTHFSSRYHAGWTEGEDRREATAEQDLEDQNRAIRQLIREACTEFSPPMGGGISAARDFYTYHVPYKLPQGKAETGM